MKTAIRDVKDVKIVDISGKLNTATSEAAGKELNALADQGIKKILVNGQNIDYIASSGIRVIMAAGIQLSNSGGELRLCSLNETVKEVFLMTSLDSVFGIYDTEEDALNDF